MKKNIRLYINDCLVDCSEDLSLPMTYSVEDFKNPTIVKNSFSKTITIPGTKENNKIFGEIYKLDRYIADHPNSLKGVKFDPSKRVDFKIFNNSSLVESGYMQLNTISVLNNVIHYNITLYGGLGDFFYNLKYTEDGEQKTLADLQYFIEDESGIVLDKDKEFNFNINKNLVGDCFLYHPASDHSNTLKDFITFIPAYNGLYEEFDNNTCLINTYEDDMFPSSITADSTTYTTYNGYGLAKLNQSYTEWEMRDLRSYKQRPALKLSRLIKTICRKENSGYDVNFDLDFFNDNNPYWMKSYVALPLLGSNETENEENIDRGVISKYNTNFWVGQKSSSETATSNVGILTAESNNLTSSGGNVDMSALPSGSLTTIDLPVQITFNPIDTYTQNDKFYLSYVLNGKSGGLVYKNHPVRTSFTVQVLVFDMDTTSIAPVAYSPIYNFTNNIPGNSPSGPQTWFNYWPFTNASVETITGCFEFLNGSFVFKSDSGSNVFHLIAKDIPKTPNARFEIVLNRYSDSSDSNLPLWKTTSIYPGSESQYRVSGNINVNWNQSSYTLSSEWSSSVASDILITKDKFLRTESSPADFLLSYAKIFGLYFTKDVNSKTINIYTRNNFFKNEVEDWSDRIDYSKDLTVNPILFEKKWYKLAAETTDTYYSNKYNKEYNLDYGQKRLDTGYNFNSETEDLYKDNIYENIVTAKDTSKYYRNFYNSSNELVPAFMNDNITYSLYKTVNNERKNTDKELYGANFIDVTKTTEWNNIPGNDIMPKLCFYNISGDSKSLSEIKSSLVLFDGYTYLSDVEGNEISYYITDDLSEMGILNDGEYCYLYTKSEYNEDGDQIAIKLTSLPKFTRYITSSNSVTHSLDFGLPKEIYDTVAYTENATIYNKFWDKFYRDQLSVNTKKVTCFVKLNDLWVNNEMLRKFYYFDNAYWLLNKIEGYDITTDKTTRCEFIKVQDLGNYLGSVDFLGSYIFFENNNIVIDHNAGSITVNVYSNIPWRVYYTTSTKITSVTPTTGEKGITQLTINYNKNEDYNTQNFYLRITPLDVNSGPSLYFIQLPDPAKTIKVTGEVTYKTSKPKEWAPHICAGNPKFTNCVYVRESNKYELYVPKNQPFGIEIQGKNGDLIESKTVSGSTKDLIINWKI